MDIPPEARFLRDHLFLQDVPNNKSFQHTFPTELDWEKFINVVYTNGLFLTIFDNIAKCLDTSCFPSWYFSRLCLEKTKKEDFLNTLESTDNIFTDTSLFLKIEKYPDVGKDIDIYVGDNLDKILNMLVEKGYKRKLSKYHMLFNRYLLFADCRNMHPIDLYPSFSRFGEKWVASSLFLKNKRKINIEDIEIYTTSLEDSVIINCISSLFLNHYLNLSSLFLIYRSVNSDNFDENYFVNMVHGAGLSFCMYYIFSILRDFTGNDDLSKLIKCFQPKLLITKFLIGELRIKSFPICIKFRIILLSYLYKISVDTLNGRFFCGFSLLTPLVASSIARFIKNRKRIK